MRGASTVLALVLVAAGCEPDAADPPPPVSEPRPEAARVEVPDSVDAAVSSSSRSIEGAQDEPGLWVAVGDDRLRLDEGAVEAVRRDTVPTLGSVLVVVMSDAAADRFAAMTGANVGRQAVVTLDGRVLVALSVQSRIPNGRFSIPLDAGASDGVEARVRAATGT